MTVKLRYKQPDGDTSALIAAAVADRLAMTPDARVRGGGRRIRHAASRQRAQGHVIVSRRGGTGADVQGRRPARPSGGVDPVDRSGGGSQSGVGRSARSMTKTSTGPLCESSFSPSCSCSAVKMDGPSVGTPIAPRVGDSGV